MSSQYVYSSMTIRENLQSRTGSDWASDLVGQLGGIKSTYLNMWRGAFFVFCHPFRASPRKPHRSAHGFGATLAFFNAGYSNGVEEIVKLVRIDREVRT